MMEREMQKVELALRATFAGDNGAKMDLDTVADIIRDLREGVEGEDIIEDHDLADLSEGA